MTTTKNTPISTARKRKTTNKNTPTPTPTPNKRKTPRSNATPLSKKKQRTARELQMNDEETPNNRSQNKRRTGKEITT